MRHAFLRSFMLTSFLSLVGWMLSASEPADSLPICSPTPILVASVARPIASSSGVSIVDFQFISMNMAVQAGETVTWTNNGSVNHTVSSDDHTTFDSGAISPGGTFSFTFANVGTFNYHCSIHPSMVGSITVSPAAAVPVISSPITASSTVGQAFSYQIVASGSPTSYNAIALPPGVTVNAASGLISGVPTANGTYNATISATNLSGTGSATLTITVASAIPGAPMITSNANVTATVGAALSFQIVATNGPITAYSISALPVGLSLDPITGMISGTPTTAGSTTGTITVTNSVGNGSAFLTIAVNAAGTTTGSPYTTSSGGGCGAGIGLSGMLVMVLMLMRSFWVKFR